MNDQICLNSVFVQLLSVHKSHFLKSLSITLELKLNLPKIKTLRWDRRQSHDKQFPAPKSLYDAENSWEMQHRFVHR